MAKIKVLEEQVQHAYKLIENSKQREKALEATVALVKEEADRHEEEFAISYQELKATERELRIHAETLELLNEQLADANVRAAELQVDLEDALAVKKKQNQELESAYERLKQTKMQLVQAEKMASLGQLVGGIAHELNNPINFVSGNTQGLLLIFEEIKSVLDLLGGLKDIKTHTAGDDMQLQQLLEAYAEIDWEQTKEDLVQLAENIKTGVSRSSLIVQNLHSFARIDGDSVGLLHVSNSIDDVWNLLGEHQTSGIALVKQVHGIRMVACNARSIHQVLMHLMKNAVDAIRAADRVDGRVEVAIWEENDNVHISIADNGVGIDDSIVSKIYEPFFTTKEIGQGMGLGLSISYNILKEHGGSIEISQKEEGTIFSLALPINSTGKQDIYEIHD